MYGGGGGGSFGGGGGGWTPWAGAGPSTGGANNNQLMQQNLLRQGMLNQQGGFAGTGGGAGSLNPNMIPIGGVMNYGAGGGGTNLMTGMGMNPYVGGMSTGMNSSMAAGNIYGNPFQQQQQQPINNQYLQQQQKMQNIQQQNQQSLFQTQTGYPRPVQVQQQQQPPLPPGPPPPQGSNNSKSTLNSGRPSPPPLPPSNNSNNYGEKPPPPPLPKGSFAASFSQQSPGAGNYSNNAQSQRRFENASDSGRKPTEPVIPDQVLKLLQNAESARQLQQAAEAIANVTPMSSLNVSQELFGVKKTDKDPKNDSIPGLDFDDVQNDLMENRSSFLTGGNSNKKNSSNNISKSEPCDKTNQDSTNSSKPIKDKDDHKTRWNAVGGESATAKEDSNKTTNRDECNKSPEIVWELRPEVQNEISSARNEGNESRDQVPAMNSSSNNPSLDETKDDSKSSSKQRVSSGDSVVEEDEGGATAKIPLESTDGKPIEYDKRTLRAFDKKFREWEQQFENWKESNQNHPDRNAYNKYLEQWNRWRQQLIDQRRFIIDSMNQAKLEGVELAMQKLEKEIKEGVFDSENVSKAPDRKGGRGDCPDNKGPGPGSRFGNQTDPARKPEPRDQDHFDSRGKRGGGGGSRWTDKEESEEQFTNDDQGTPPWYRNEDFTSDIDCNDKLLKNPHFRGPTEIQHALPPQEASSSGPTPLMAINVEPPPSLQNNNDTFVPNPFHSSAHLGGGSKSQSPDQLASQANKISGDDRTVERIPRDKDRPHGILGTRPPGSKGPESWNKNNSSSSVDRVARDPAGGNHGLRNRVNQDLMDPDPWAAMNRPDTNPFSEALANSRNAPPSAAPATAGGWGRTSEDNLPKLSDFLQRDTSVPVPNVAQGIMTNRGMLSNPNPIQYNANRYPDQQYNEFNRRLPSMQGPGKGKDSISLNPGSRPFHTLLNPAEEDYEEDQDSSLSRQQGTIEWFTRDRSTAFDYEEEETFQEVEPQENIPNSNDYEWEPDAPAVIDYGHGSKDTDERDEYDLPKGERLDDDETDEERDREVVTIDYGHGGGGGGDIPNVTNAFTREREHERSRRGFDRRIPVDDEYYEQEEAYNEAYRDDPFQNYPPSRGQGINPDLGSLGRGSIQPISRGRGRGLLVGTPLPPSSMTRRPPDLGYNRELPPRRNNEGLLNPDSLSSSRGMNRPMPNRGSGRGVPIQLPVYSGEPETSLTSISSPGHGRGVLVNRSPIDQVQFERSRGYNDHDNNEDLGTERVDSPEIMIIPSESPRREGGGVRRAPFRDERSGSDRISRDRDSRRDNNNSRRNERNDRNDFRKRSRSKEDFRVSAFLDESWEPEDQPENKPPPPPTERSSTSRRDDRNEEPRRVRRDISPPVRRDRSRDRSRDRGVRIDRERESRDNRDRHGHQSSSRSRSRRSRSPFSRSSGEGGGMESRIMNSSVTSAVTPFGSTLLTPMDHNNSSGMNPPPPRFQTVMIEDILNRPGRLKRPIQIVVILRGLPGSGKTHVAKLIKDREVEMGGSAPRILSLDDYFMVESETIVKDPVTGAESKETLLRYEYEEDLEPKYRNDLLKAFKKTIENGFFQFIIVDCVNSVVKHIEDMASYAIMKRFQVYVAEVDESVETCVKRNIHNRTKDQILKLQKNWERTPPHFVKLDVRQLLQDEAVQDVEMEDVSDNEIASEPVASKAKAPISTPSTQSWEDEEQQSSQMPAKSKWEIVEQSEEKLNKLDGLNARKKNTDEVEKIESQDNSSWVSWLSSLVPADYLTRDKAPPGQKRVRWADLEEMRAQQRMRQLGFVVGQTDWQRMTDPTFGSGALTSTKYI